MRYMVGILMVGLLVGCATPPKPTMPDGEYRPINKTSNLSQSKKVFDFTYEGDIQGALLALREVAPQINVMPSLGKPSPLPVRLTLRGATLEDALRAIGAQGGVVADVVWNTTQHQGGNQVFIRFRARHE